MKREQEYPKQIETLVEDIYNLFGAKHVPKEENLNALVDGLRTIITNRLGEDRSEVRDSYLRMSSIGKPDRQLWYQMRLEHNEQTHKPLDGQTALKFLFGDIVELLVLFLTAEAGHTIENEQKTVTVEGVEGHLDCTIDGVVVDVKSASAFGMKKFRDGSLVTDDPFGYVGQISGYKHAIQEEYGHRVRQGFLAFGKETAELVLCLIPENKTIDVPERIEGLKQTFLKDTPPERCFTSKPEENGNVKLPKGCSWCAFKDVCHSDANNGRGLRVFQYSSGPEFFTKVVKAPKVDEITDRFFKLPKKEQETLDE